VSRFDDTPPDIDIAEKRPRPTSLDSTRIFAGAGLRLTAFLATHV